MMRKKAAVVSGFLLSEIRETAYLSQYYHRPQRDINTCCHGQNGSTAVRFI